MKRPPHRRMRNIFLITMVVVFSVLIAGGLLIFKNEAPRPSKIVDQQGNTLVTKAQLVSGQAVYERYGLGDYGSYLGDGAYLGPDYTAEALHQYIQGMYKYYAQKLYKKDFSKLTTIQQGGIEDQVKTEIKVNRYNPKTQQLVLTSAQAAGFKYMQDYYRKTFINNPQEAGLPENLIKAQETDQYMTKGNKVDQLSAFFFWGAWMSSTNRPGDNVTYTNNFPYDLQAGNTLSGTAMVWTAISVALLCMGVAVVIWFQRRYHLEMKDAYPEGQVPALNPDKPITRSQRKTAKYLVIVMLMFIVQVLLGELMSHYYIENTFFGLPLQNIWPFNLALTWHLQLVIFWIATAWLATGIYIVPRVLGREPKHQGSLVDFLFWALIVCIAGSMLGEWASLLDQIKGPWWIFGQFGWKYIELGKFWQIVFIAATLLWLFILARGFLPKIIEKTKKGFRDDRTHLSLMLFIGAIAIPGFYLASLFIMPDSHVTFADYWRWWIVHLWVEGIFESFAVMLIGWLLVDMKLTTVRSTIRALYFQLILLLGAGVIGMGHHYYFQGDDSIWLALGSSFSALEIIPLTLLLWEAWTHYKVYKDSGIDFPYKGTFMFLASTGFWNTLGAGALGFLINAPAINYFEHGTQWTSAHAHAAMAGVYAFFSVAIMIYTLRNVTKKEFWTAKTEKLLRISNWLLNIGLAGMVFITLMPVGYLQLADALTNGYWHARLTSFYRTPLVSGLIWARIVPDLVFTAGVIVLAYVFIKGFFNLKKADDKGFEEMRKVEEQELEGLPQD